MKTGRVYEKMHAAALDITFEGSLTAMSEETYSVTSDETAIIPEEFDDGYDFGQITF